MYSIIQPGKYPTMKGNAGDGLHTDYSISRPIIMAGLSDIQDGIERETHIRLVLFCSPQLKMILEQVAVRRPSTYITGL